MQYPAKCLTVFYVAFLNILKDCPNSTNETSKSAEIEQISVFSWVYLITFYQGWIPTLTFHYFS
uniref:Uncharacterized protein n=1 Tax=Anguilla anguilla TaxID=7936 RepID=A0A0E9U2E2_ANGAN